MSGVEFEKKLNDLFRPLSGGSFMTATNIRDFL